MLGKKSACQVRQHRLSNSPITYFSLYLALLFHGHTKRPCPDPIVGLGARLSECMCARKVLVSFQESFNATTIFLQLRHFLLDVFQEVCVRSIIAVKLTNSSATQNHVVFQPTSEQDKYGTSGILKRNQKRLLQFSFEVNNYWIFR